ASPRAIVPNSPLLPFSPVSRLRVIPAITDSSRYWMLARGSGRCAPLAGRAGSGVSDRAQRQPVIAGGDDTSGQVTETLGTAVAPGRRSSIWRPGLIGSERRTEGAVSH